MRSPSTLRFRARATLCAIAALGGCASLSDEGAFRLSAEEMNGAWGAVMARAIRDAEAQGIEPLWDPVPPSYSGATCRWIEPQRRARCRYRVARGLVRRGSERRWVEEESDMYLTDRGWDFGY